MKTLLSMLSVILLSAACNESPKKDTSEQKVNFENEKKSILTTIQKETESFFARDYEAWKSNYAQTDYAFQAWSNDDGTFDSNVGWEDINRKTGKYIAENPEPLSSHPKVERKNMNYKFYGDNVAYLTWDQFNSDKPERNFHHSKEVRLLEKINGKWKIVCVSAFWDYKHLIPADRLPQIQRIANESGGKTKI